MGFCDFVSSVCSTVCGAVSSAVSSIGSALSSFASGVGSVIAGVVSALAPVAEALGKFASAFLQGLGILKPDEKAEDLGERALQAAEKGITLGQFDDFDSYVDALRNFELDPEKAANRSQAEKLVAGIGIGNVGLERKFNASPGSFDSLWLLPMANPDYFTPDRMQSLVNTGRFSGDVFAYLEKRLSAGDSSRLESALEACTGQSEPDASSKEKLYVALDQASDHWKDLVQQVQGGRGE